MSVDIPRLTTEVFVQLGIAHPTTRQTILVQALFDFLADKPQFHAHSRLSAREKTCLYFLAQGKNLEEIAQNMQIKRTTVATFIKRIKAKLDCDTLAQAVFVGMNQEEIPKLS